jgi:hypothetical protein
MEEEILAGWVARLQTRFLGAVVPAALLPTHCKASLAVANGCLNGLGGSIFWDQGFSTRSRSTRLGQGREMRPAMAPNEQHVLQEMNL